jgi:hypothetical protein
MLGLGGSEPDDGPADGTVTGTSDTCPDEGPAALVCAGAATVLEGSWGPDTGMVREV